MRVLLVDDHTHIRHMLGELLREQTDMELVGEAQNGREAVVLAHGDRHELPADWFSTTTAGARVARRCLEFAVCTRDWLPLSP